MTVPCDNDLDHSNPLFHWNLWLMMIYDQPTFDWRRVISSEDTAETIICFRDALIVTLTLKTANQSFCMALWFVIMHHYAGIFRGTEDIVWTNIHWHFKSLLSPWPWSWTLQPNLFKRQKIQELMSCPTMGIPERIHIYMHKNLSLVPQWVGLE